MMKKQIVVMFVVWLFTTCNLLDVNAQQFRDYVVITSKEMQSDKAWMKVVEVLSKRHKATVLYYDKQLRELLAELRRLTPRYVAVVEKPENLNREFVMEGHRLSREIDDDIYADYLWGIITGYSAADAMAAELAAAADAYTGKNTKEKVYLVGPVDAAIAKVNDIYKKIIYLKAESYDTLVKIKNRTEVYARESRYYKNVTVMFDFNPVNGF